MEIVINYPCMLEKIVVDCKINVQSIAVSIDRIFLTYVYILYMVIHIIHIYFALMEILRNEDKKKLNLLPVKYPPYSI